MTQRPWPHWLPKEIEDMYNASSDSAHRFIETLAPTRYSNYNTAVLSSNYTDNPNKIKINHVYAALILDQLVAEFNLSPIFKLEYSEFTTMRYRREQTITYLTKSRYDYLPMRSYQDVTAVFHDQDFLIQIDTDKCRPLHIHFSHILSRDAFCDMPKISGEWPNNIDKVKQELKKQMMIKIVET